MAKRNCLNCGQEINISKDERIFLEKLDLPEPKLYPVCRSQRRWAVRNPRKLYYCQCMCEEPGHDHDGRCKDEFEITYALDRLEKVYCESCYQESVI